MPSRLEHFMVLRCVVFSVHRRTKPPAGQSALKLSHLSSFTLTWMLTFTAPSQNCLLPPTHPPTFYTEILNLVQTSIFCLRAITFETSSFWQPPRVEFCFPLQTGDFVTPKQVFFLLLIQISLFNDRELSGRVGLWLLTQSLTWARRYASHTSAKVQWL